VGRSPTSEDGFSLIETLIAAMLVIVALASLAQLFVIAVAANRAAGSVTLATILAREKMEEIISIDEDGVHANADGVDFADAQGRPLGTGLLPPPGSVYTRRWQSAAVSHQPAARVAQVWVTPTANRSGAELIRIVTLKPTRLPRSSP
jgi:type II secretory pathway pseudopilin PulG